ncbi:MAG: aromatic ring-hydroxylating dioxygenase subunit alpha, partial [Pseudomonadota bacterium]
MSDGHEEDLIKQAQARCEGMSYSEMLDLDTRPVPEFLREESSPALGSEPLAAERYTSPDFFAEEKTKMWPYVWQFAAREEELPEAGDHVVYENAGKTFLLIRQEDGSIRGFYNVCLHRGRKLRTESGHAAELECPFHGFTWNNDGSIKRIPCRWDFEHLSDAQMTLPEVRIDRWAGFVMLSEDKDIAPFREWIGPDISHYERWKLEDCYTGAWIGKVIPANWKAVAEAFMEAYHAVITHPQILPFTGDANTRYDLYGDHMNRAITPSASLSPHLSDTLGQDYVLKGLQEFASSGSDDGSSDARAKGKVKAGDRFTGTDAAEIDKADPVLARKVVADANRDAFAAMSGLDHSQFSDTEMVDNFTYNIFPNFAPWGGFIPNIVYRWRPWHDQDHCLMEVRILMRGKPGETPPVPEMHLIGDGEAFTSAAHL